MESRLSASGKLVATVNSVVAEWSIEVPDASSEPQRQPIGVVGVLTPRTPAPNESERSDLHEAHGTAGEDATIRVSGVSEFHFLWPGRKYDFTLQVAGSGDSKPLLRLEAQTLLVGQGLSPMLAHQLPPEMWRTYVGPEHALGEWLGDCPEDCVWAVQPTYDFLRSLWLNACFTLPSPQSPITQCPNPISRYCLDLCKTAPGLWLKSKKVRRHKAEFRLTVNADYPGTFMRCERTHSDDGRGKWITKELVNALDKCRKENGEIKVYSVELWDKKTGDLAAAIMAFSVGDIFHDYSTATMQRDSRSAGAILTKVTGHLLVECGYTLWYWGFKNPYMAEYDGPYGGTQLDNSQEFWPRWRQALSGARALMQAGIQDVGDLIGAPRCELSTRVPPGGLDLATL